jgi:hypothetical protein
VNRASSIGTELLLDNIPGVASSSIVAYFNNLNSGDFAATAALFTDDGCLHPPFEQPIVGRDEIATYLEREARGMIFCPESGAMLIKDNDLTQYHIQGRVKTNYFTIHVSWLMQLTPAVGVVEVRSPQVASPLENRICLVEIKLLAPLSELLKIKR